MPRDDLQIALEHHRCGRLRQAESGYRTVLSGDPQNADAAHWLGVLLVQAGQADEAIPLLERAAAARPDDPAVCHNLAQDYLRAGRADDAVRAFERALELDPTRAEVLLGSGLAKLARRQPGDAQAAVQLLQRARQAGLDSPELHHYSAIALMSAGRLDEAIDACRIAVARQPDLPEAHYQLGLALRLQGNSVESRRCVARALELDPTSARNHQALAAIELEEGRLTEAEALLRKAIELRPHFAPAHQALAIVLGKMGREDEATAAMFHAMQLAARRGGTSSKESDASTSAVPDLERKLTPSKETAALHLRLALQAGIVSPAQVPPEKLTGLFDRYAGFFDEHLRDRLEYRVPEMLTEAVVAAGAGNRLSVLDLGCGTGLCGPLLRSRAELLWGVDLSPAMIAKARERGVYDRLEVIDLIEMMREWPQAFDLLVAADVLIYTGDLAPTFEAAAGCLRPGGLFAFSVEAGPADRYELNKTTHRFTHSEAYLRHLATIYGFRQESISAIMIRHEAGRPVGGHLAILRSPDGCAAPR